MFLAPFEGPRQLIQRSKHHAGTLASYIEEVTERLQIDFVEVDRNEYDLVHYRLQFSEEPDPELGMVFREGINNLAVCLDVTLCDLARIAEKPIDKVKFPFAKTEKGFKGILRDIGLGPVFEEWIQTVHPAYGSNGWLIGLHDLDVLMKHRVVVPVFAAAPGMPLANLPEDVRAFMANSLGFDVTRFTTKWRHGSSIHLKSDINPVNAAQFTGSVELYLPDTVPFEGVHVITVLESLASGISGFVDDVEKLSKRMKP